MKIIEPIIMDTDFKELGTIDDYISLIWTTRYYKNGDFELCLDVDNEYLDMIRKDYYIYREDDENVGIIQNITIEINEDQKEMMIIKGKFLPCVLARRIIAVQTQLSGTVSNAVYNLISDNVIDPVIEDRKIEDFLVEYSNFTDKIDAQYTGKNLLETIESICETYGLGFKTVLNDQNEIVFSLYRGVDRSYNQEDNPHIIFSDEFDNLLSSSYQENYENIVTDVLVAGEGEGNERKTLWVSTDTNTGLKRYEMYQDQRNLSTNNGEINEDEYYEQMKEEGLENITTFTTAFNGQVYFDNYEYKKDIFMGDICVIENNRWNIFINTRLIEIIESVSENGEYTVTPTFGV